MKYKEIDMTTYKRIEHFNHFIDMSNPLSSLTVQMDITEWKERIRKEGKPFFLSFMYEMSEAANAVPQLRQRIKDRKIVEYDSCPVSYLVMTDDESYRYCKIETNIPFDEYLAKAKIKEEEAKKAEHLVEEGDPLELFFVSCIPWVSFSGIDIPCENNQFSNPSFIFGKAYEQNGRILIPISLWVNHALVDGLHMSRFFKKLEERLK